MVLDGVYPPRIKDILPGKENRPTRSLLCSLPLPLSTKGEGGDGGGDGEGGGITNGAGGSSWSMGSMCLTRQGAAGGSSSSERWSIGSIRVTRRGGGSVLK
jgi:hypothetical protein